MKGRELWYYSKGGTCWSAEREVNLQCNLYYMYRVKKYGWQKLCVSVVYRVGRWYNCSLYKWGYRVTGLACEPLVCSQAFKIMYLFCLGCIFTMSMIDTNLCRLWEMYDSPGPSVVKVDLLVV